MISFDKPEFLFALFAVIPSVSYTVFYIKRITRSLGVLYGDDLLSLKKYASLKKALYGRTLCFVLAWTALIFALSNPSWGTSSVPVQKTGTAVSFVFDISHSMNAEDAFPKSTMTRLSASSQYAAILVNRMHSDPQERPAVSMVIAKGEGVLALPFSEDYYSASSFLSSLSSSLMTAPGSNIGGGLRCAVRSFPANHARYSTVLIFTDGDETVSSLEEAADEALKYGINIVLIGFGSVEGSQVVTGDGETYVKTMLQEDTLKSIVKRLKIKYPLHTNAIHYINASDSGSASKIMSIINPFSLQSEKKAVINYEVQPIRRHSLFLLLSLAFFTAGILLSESHAGIKKVFSIFLIIPLFFSCSVSFNDGAELLQGSIYWHQGRYQNATVSFLQVIESAVSEKNEQLLFYGVYNLAATYMKQNEQDSALQKLAIIDEQAPVHLLFASYYNSGVIEYEKKNYKKAAEYFKNALKLQNENIDAKINLELSLLHIESEQKTSSMTISPLSESKGSNSAQDAIFSIIRENEQNRWKNQQMENSSEGGLDH